MHEAHEKIMLTLIGKRVVALEMQENLTTLKTAVDTLDTTVGGWELRGADGALPSDAEVKAALAAYDAISKPAMTITDALADVRAVV